MTSPALTRYADAGRGEPVSTLGVCGTRRTLLWPRRAYRMAGVAPPAESARIAWLMARGEGSRHRDLCP
jgi:hypothetical protein